MLRDCQRSWNLFVRIDTLKLRKDGLKKYQNPHFQSFVYKGYLFHRPTGSIECALFCSASVRRLCNCQFSSFESSMLFDCLTEIRRQQRRLVLSDNAVAQPSPPLATLPPTVYPNLNIHGWLGSADSALDEAVYAAYPGLGKPPVSLGALSLRGATFPPRAFSHCST